MGADPGATTTPLESAAAPTQPLSPDMLDGHAAEAGQNLPETTLDQSPPQ
jgi:hypothetical protein